MALRPVRSHIGFSWVYMYLVYVYWVCACWIYVY